MTPEQYYEMTPEQEAAYDRADQRGDSNPYMARAALGITVEVKLPTTPKAKKDKIIAERDGDALAREIANEFDAKNPPPSDQNEINARGKALAQAHAVKTEKRW